jgi:hypothetical protein
MLTPTLTSTSVTEFSHKFVQCRRLEWSKINPYEFSQAASVLLQFVVYFDSVDYKLYLSHRKVFHSSTLPFLTVCYFITFKKSICYNHLDIRVILLPIKQVINNNLKPEFTKLRL